MSGVPEATPLDRLCAPATRRPCLSLSDRRRCFEEQLYEAAKILYSHTSAWGKLASTLVRLHQFQQVRRTPAPPRRRSSASEPRPAPSPARRRFPRRARAAPPRASARRLRRIPVPRLSSDGPSPRD